MRSRRDASSSHRLMLSVCIGFVLLFLTWAFVGQLDVVVSAQGRVIADGYTRVVQAPLPGAVRAIRVSEGELVKPGTVLLELDARSDNADLGAVREKLAKARAELARMDGEFAGKPTVYDGMQRAQALVEGQEALRRARDLVFSERRAQARAALESRRSALAAGEQALGSARTRMEIVAEKERRARPYVDIAMPRFQYLQLKDDVTTLEGTIQVQEQTNKRLRAEIEESQRTLGLIESDRNATLLSEISDRRLTISQFESDLVRAERRSSDNEIRAPIEGYVQKLHVLSVGATVAFNEVVASLVPKESDLLVEAFLASDQIGFVRIGQAVDIKIDAYPYQKYGKVQGTLVWVSPDAEEWSAATKGFMTDNQSLKTAANSGSALAYRIKVKPIVKTGSFMITPGMTLTVDIFTDKRRVIDFFLFPVSAALDDALRVR